MIKYLAYCQGDILLTTEGTIPFGIEPPIPLKEWNYITNLHIGEYVVAIIRLDNPVSGNDGLQMVGLRKTHAILPEGRQVSRVTLLGPEHTFLRSLWWHKQLDDRHQ